MRVAVSVCAVALLSASTALGAPATSAPGHDLFGTWVLDRAASHLKGARLDIGEAPNGFVFQAGATRFVIGKDGRFYPTVPGRTTSLRRVDARHWLRVHRNGGKDVDRSAIALSGDGQLLTIATTAPNHAPQVETLHRIGAGHGLAGAWRSDRPDTNVADRLSFAPTGAGLVRWGSAADGNYYVVAPNGPSAVNQGTTSVSSATLQVRVSAGRYEWVERVAGAPYRTGRTTVSSDGTRLVEQSWPSIMPDERQVAVYRRTATKRIHS